MTTGFSRIRIPIVFYATNGGVERMVEKLVLVTSADRTIVAAHSSRPVIHSNMLNGCEHNTPLVLCARTNEIANVTVEIYGSNYRTVSYEMVYDSKMKNYHIPDSIDIKSKNFNPIGFDAPVPKKRSNDTAIFHFSNILRIITQL